ERVSGAAVRGRHDRVASTGGGLQVTAQDVGVTGPDLQHRPVGGGADQVVGAGDDLVAAFDVPDELIAGLLLFKPGQCLLGGGQLAGDPFPGALDECPGGQWPVDRWFGAGDGGDSLLG